jgi:hypothetical protein
MAVDILSISASMKKMPFTFIVPTTICIYHHDYFSQAVPVFGGFGLVGRDTVVDVAVHPVVVPARRHLRRAVVGGAVITILFSRQQESERERERERERMEIIIIMEMLYSLSGTNGA